MADRPPDTYEVTYSPPDGREAALARIATALERIANALERSSQPFAVPFFQLHEDADCGCDPNTVCMNAMCPRMPKVTF